MTITIDPKLEARLREKAEAEGLTVSAYVERLVNADQTAEEELEALALEGLNSGPAIEEVGPGFWEELHKDLDERLKRTGTH
jgi:broad specificity phosphatase PhoE